MSFSVPNSSGATAAAPTFALARFAASLQGDALAPDIKTIRLDNSTRGVTAHQAS